MARSWVPISYVLAHMVLPLFSWLEKHIRPSDPDRMTNTALEAVQFVFSFVST